MVGLPGTRPEPPDPLLLLGQVGQLEVQPEGPDEHLGPGQVDGIHLGGQRASIIGAVRATQRDGRQADALDEVEQLLALLLHDDLAQERAQQLDLARQRVARAGGPDAARLGSDGGVRTLDRRWP